MARTHGWILALGCAATLAACGGAGPDVANPMTTATSSTTMAITTTATAASAATTTTTTTTGAATSTTAVVPALTIPPEIVIGTGDIQVTLIWDTDSDMDLRVVEPSGYEISHHQRQSESGGSLDLDDIPGAGEMGPHVENVFWPDDGAPSGRYFAYVQHYGSNGTNPGPYTLEVRVGSQLIHQETGLIPMYENSTYFEFEFGG